MNIVLAIAPHPDDESLGCAGTLLKHQSHGDEIHWLIMTEIVKKSENERQIVKRGHEIKQVEKLFGFSTVHRAGFTTTTLDQVSKNTLIDAISAVIKQINPTILYLPFWGDIHSDHYHVFEAASVCTKNFRYPSVKKVRVYETLSETEYAIRPDRQFLPNLWIDISLYLEKKIQILQVYESELGEHPFPRSLDNVRALARLRGAVANCDAAEAFMSIKEVL